MTSQEIFNAYYHDLSSPPTTQTLFYGKINDDVVYKVTMGKSKQDKFWGVIVLQRTNGSYKLNTDYTTLLRDYKSLWRHVNKLKREVLL